MKRYIYLLAFLALSLQLSAQIDSSGSEQKRSPFQFTFVTPIGTNGAQSYAYTNEFSINLFAGYNGGLDGFEIGGFANILRGDMDGMQAAGFLNGVLGDAQGAQFAGFANITLGEFRGGMQASGFANIINSHTTAMQIGGFANIVNGYLQGLQASGFANYAQGLEGAQIASFANMNNGNLNGVQVSGFANISTGEINGGQVSGFVNFANKINGVQIGIINYANEMNGVPIGILSFVKNGFRQIEIGGNESFYTNLSYKTGHRRFYNILSAGASIKNNQILWGFGYGIGTSFVLDEKLGLQTELISYHVNEDEIFTDRLNSLNKLNLTFSYQLSEFIQVYAGPSFNVFVSQNNYEVQSLGQSAIIPWSFFDKTYRDNVRVTMYPGFTLGIRL